MDFAGLGDTGVSEALTLQVCEMVPFGCGAVPLTASLSGSPLPSFSPLSFPASFCGGTFSSQAGATAQLSAGDWGALDMTGKMGERIDWPGRRQVKRDLTPSGQDHRAIY